VQTVTLTFLFTDIEGSTALLRRLGQAAYTRVLDDHHRLIRDVLAEHDGRELNTMGDGFFAAFSSPRSSLTAVLEMQRALEAHDWPAGEHVRVRMGVHTGEAADTDTGLVGLDVHRAARIAAVAHGGQIVLSETAAALARDSLPAGAVLVDLGLHRLKDLGRPEQLFQLQFPGLQAEFSPLRSLGNPALPNNLPAQLTTFIGRRSELTEVKALVESARLVTLTGAGGAGKTRLSLQVAAELLDGSGDGVWLVELAALTEPEAVGPAICETLRISRQTGRPALDTLLDALAPQDALIVLDNCEHLIDACAKIADAILRRCPGMHLLATSREPLAIAGEVIYRVPSLSLPDPEAAGEPASSDAVALFLERAAAQGISLPADEDTGALITSVCRRLDGMPLAIELAAARLRSMSLSDLESRLDQRFRLLTGGSRTVLERQQTLRATVDWSYSLLNAAEAQLLRRLSVFAESFDLPAAESVCGFGDIEPPEVADLLGSLVDKSLVATDLAAAGMRYRMLETIRQFAAERLLDTGADEATGITAAHASYYLDLAETAAPHLVGPDQLTWLERLDRDLANLRRAAEHAAGDQAGPEQILRFAAALKNYWLARMRNDELLRLLSPVLSQPADTMSPPLRGRALVTAAFLGRTMDPPAALRYGEEAVDIARQISDEPLLAEALAVLCGNYYFAGEPERGYPLGEESVQRARKLGDDSLLAGCLAGFLLASDVVDPGQSEQLFAEAIEHAERSGDQLVASLLYNNAAVRALRADDMPAARALLEDADRTARLIGGGSHHVAVNLGWVLRNEGDPDGARSMFERGMRISRRDGERHGVAYASLGLACLAADRADWERAALLHGAAQALLEVTGEPWQDPELRYREQSAGAVRAAMGEDRFERRYAQGTAMSVPDVLDLVLGKKGQA